jgi:hypothetical protein
VALDKSDMAGQREEVLEGARRWKGVVEGENAGLAAFNVLGDARRTVATWT